MSRYADERSDTRYRPTPSHVCDVGDYPIPLDDQLELNVHIETHRGLTRRFSLELRTAGQVVSRIDTDHSVVHRHQYYSDGTQDSPPHYIESIPEGRDGPTTVDRMYDEAYEYMLEHAEQMLRRWRG